METCQRCGGAKFYGSGAVGWGGTTCNCQYPQVPNPDVPSQNTSALGYASPPISQFNQILERLERIEAKLDTILEAGE